MKSSKGIKFFICFIINTLIVLLPNDSYSMQKNEKTPNQVIIGGQLLHLELNTNNVIIFGVDENLKIKNYDLVNSVSGDVVKRIFNKEKIEIASKEDLTMLIISMKENDKLKFNLLRNDKIVISELKKNEINPINFIDKVPYTATLTYIDPINYKFKAVGHSIEFFNNKNIISNNGEIYDSNIDTINKSSKKYVGNISGKKIKHTKGNIVENDECGISGYMNKKYENEKLYKVANNDDVNLGYAYIVMKHDSSRENKYYKIKITKLNKSCDGNLQSFNFKVIDKDLMRIYGGITQGMSGSPIIQNKKIVGALSHVITSDTSNGVGVYIKVMMKE